MDRPALRQTTIRRLVIWIAGSIIGALVVAVPDDDARIFSLSPSHGPSAVDLLGIAIMVVAWLPIVALLWTARSALRGKWAVIAALLAAAGLLVLLVSIAADMDRQWMLGAAMLVGAQLLALAAIGTAPTKP